MSKSLGNVVDPVEAADRFGVDPLRLYLVKEVPYGGDGDFTWERLGEKYNADLANNLGNLVSRVAAMTRSLSRRGVAAGAARRDVCRESPRSALAEYRSAMDRFALHEGVAAVVPSDRRDQPVHRRNSAMGARQTRGGSRPPHGGLG